MQAIQELKLYNPLEDIDRLILFYEVAQPLRKLLSNIPKFNSINTTIVPTVRAEHLNNCNDVAELISKAKTISIATEIPIISEELFERLALRFRPFFMNDEPTNFLRILNLLKRLNPDLHVSMDEYKARWGRAVFWGAMSLSVKDVGVVVTADELIKVGFYSKYFHVDKKNREIAARYEAALGSEKYWAALISSVWQRALIIEEFSKGIGGVLLGQGFVSEEKLRELEADDSYPRNNPLIFYDESVKMELKEIPQ